MHILITAFIALAVKTASGVVKLFFALVRRATSWLEHMHSAGWSAHVGRKWKPKGQGALATGRARRLTYLNLTMACWSGLAAAFELIWRARSHWGQAGASLVARSLSAFAEGISPHCTFTAVQCAQRTGKGGRELREGNCIPSLISQFGLGNRFPVELG